MIRLLIRIHIYGLHHCHIFDSALVYDRYQLPVIEFSCFHCLSDWLQKLFEINRLIKVNFLEINWLKNFFNQYQPYYKHIECKDDVIRWNTVWQWSWNKMEGIFGGRLIETAYRRIQRGLLQEDSQYSNKLRGKNQPADWGSFGIMAIKTLFVCVSVCLIPGVVCVDIFGRQFTSKSS